MALVDRDGPSLRLKAAAIYEGLAEWYQEKGHTTGQFRSLERAVALVPEGTGEGVRDALEAMREEYETNAEALRKSIESGTGDLNDQVNLAVLHARHGRYALAGELFGRLPPGDPEIAFYSARYHWESRDTREGYARAEEIYRWIEGMLDQFPEEVRNSLLPQVDGALRRVSRERSHLEESLRR
jgi:hypothetical protein